MAAGLCQPPVQDGRKGRRAAGDQAARGQAQRGQPGTRCRGRPRDSASHARPCRPGDDQPLHPHRDTGPPGSHRGRGQARGRSGIVNGCSNSVPTYGSSSRSSNPSGGTPEPAANSVYAGQRRRTGIEPADDAERRPPVLKTGGATRHPDASANRPYRRVRPLAERPGLVPESRLEPTQARARLCRRVPGGRARRSPGASARRQGPPAVPRICRPRRAEPR